MHGADEVVCVAEVLEGDSEAQTLEGTSESPCDQSDNALLAARMALTQILFAFGVRSPSSRPQKVSCTYP